MLGQSSKVFHIVACLLLVELDLKHELAQLVVESPGPAPLARNYLQHSVRVEQVVVEEWGVLLGQGEQAVLPAAHYKKYTI